MICVILPGARRAGKSSGARIDFTKFHDLVPLPGFLSARRTPPHPAPHSHRACCGISLGASSRRTFPAFAPPPALHPHPHPRPHLHPQPHPHSHHPASPRFLSARLIAAPSPSLSHRPAPCPLPGSASAALRCRRARCPLPSPLNDPTFTSTPALTCRSAPGPSGPDVLLRTAACCYAAMAPTVQAITTPLCPRGLSACR